MKNKKIVTVVVAAALSAILGIGGTFAYLTAKTNDATNTFTMGSGITGHTDEPKWNPKNAENFVPGKVITKDPQVVNDSKVGTDDAYVGMTIKYQVKDSDGKWVDATYADLDKFINIKTLNADGKTYSDGFNTAAWTMAKDNTLAYYNSKLAPQATTAALFDAVEIDQKALTPEQVKSADTTNVQFDKSAYTKEVVGADGKTTTEYTYTTYTMKDFQIVVQGYMVQESGFATPQIALQTAFSDIFTE